MVGKQEVIESIKRLARMTKFLENGVFGNYNLVGTQIDPLPPGESVN